MNKEIMKAFEYGQAISNIRARRKLYKEAKLKAVEIFNIHLNLFYKHEKYLNGRLAKENSIATVNFTVDELSKRVPCAAPQFNNDRIENFWKIVIKQIERL